MFHQNPSSDSRVVSYGQTEGQTDMTKLILAFRNFAKAPKNRVENVRIGPGTGHDGPDGE